MKSFLLVLIVEFSHFSADVLTDYVEFVNKENSKKQTVETDVLVGDASECIDHLINGCRGC